jgi:hypothetical protein
VDGHTDRHDRGQPFERPGPAAGGQVGVLDADGRGPGPAVLGPGDQPGDLVGVEDAVGVVDDLQLGRLVDAERAALVGHDVLAAPGHDQRSGGGQHPEGDLVRHRARGHEHGRGHARERGVAVLQPDDGGVVAEAVVAHLGVGHGGAHGRGRAGDGVAPQVDGRRDGDAGGHRGHGTVVGR